MSQWKQVCKTIDYWLCIEKYKRPHDTEPTSSDVSSCPKRSLRAPAYSVSVYQNTEEKRCI